MDNNNVQKLGSYMTSRVAATAVIMGVALFAHSPGAAAKGGSLAPGIGINLGVEYYAWEEFDQSGTSLLRESGPRGSLSLSIDNVTRPDAGIVYRVYGHGYYGDVNYDGQTQFSVPVTSNTRYIGGGVEADGGYRFANVFDTYSFDVTGAAGVDAWQRRIADAQTATGDFVNGSTEDYRIVYVKLGVALFHVRHRWANYVQLGVKRPVDSREVAHINLGVANRLTLSPKNQVSFYLRWQITRLNNKQERTVSAAFYYESFRFDPSASVTAREQLNGSIQQVSAYQPESHQDVFGLEIGYYFNPF